MRITTVPISLKLLLGGQFTYFQNQGFDVLTVSADGPEAKDMVAQGVHHKIIPMTRAITPFHDLICLFKLVRLIHTFKPSIVHTHTPKAGLLGMLAAWLCSVQVRMHTVAGLPLMEAKGVKQTVLKMTERITYGCATNVYPNSKGLLKYIKEQLSMDNCELTIIGKGSSNGIDSSYFSRTTELENAAKEIRKHHRIPVGGIVFGFVGRMVKDKGIVELITAFTMINKTREDVYLLLVGPLEQKLDPLPQEVLRFIQNDPHVIVAGYQNDVRPWMMAADVFVFPSYREGFPNVVLQAACLEVPCIVSDINGCNEIIEDKRSGLIVPAKNSSALYKAMVVLSTNAVLYHSFRLKAREFVVSNFDQQFVWRELLDEYQQLLAKRTVKSKN
jgi:glycosyltransferase involved in cell wall biosynthesis